MVLLCAGEQWCRQASSSFFILILKEVCGYLFANKLVSVEVCNFAKSDSGNEMAYDSVIVVVPISHMQIKSLSKGLMSLLRNNSKYYSADLGSEHWVAMESDGLLIHIMSENLYQTYDLITLYSDMGYDCIKYDMNQ